MTDPQQAQTKPIGIVAGIAVLILAVGGGITWWTLSSRTRQEPAVVSPTPTQSPRTTPTPTPLVQPSVSPTPTQSPTPTPTPTPPVQATPSPPAQQAEIETTVDVYWIAEKDGQFQLTATPISFTVSDDPSSFIEAGLNRLLESPPENQYSEIPPGTKLLSVKSSPNEVYIDLSSEFTSGGGSLSMIGRLGQVIYTATSLNPEAKVWISVNNKPLEVLGGEGLEIPQPTTRQQFEQEFPFE